MNRICIALVLALAAPWSLLRAHTTEMLGGRLAMRAGGVVELRLEISASRLPVFAQLLPDSFVTWGDLRAQEGFLADCFQRSLVVFVDGKETGPSDVELPGLVRAADADPLPDFVIVLVLWRGLPFVPGAVIPRFDLNEAYVMLLLDDRLGGPPDAEPADEPAPVPLAATVETGTGADTVTAPVEPPVANVPAGSWWRMMGRAVVVGFEHIVPHGLDHILFVLGLFFAVRRFRDLVGQVTMFTVAHSITLGLAMAGVVVLGDTWSTVVEIGIAVSIVAVAVENCLVRHAPGWRRLIVIGVFGLIHGLGFAGALSEINWPADQFAAALFAANVGIELGQLTVVAGAALFTVWVWRRNWYRAWIAVPASVAIGACGLYWAIERAAGAL